MTYFYGNLSSESYVTIQKRVRERSLKLNYIKRSLFRRKDLDNLNIQIRDLDITSLFRWEKTGEDYKANLDDL